MTGDIDLEGVESHPIGSTIYPFAGVFDGGGFSISNLPAAQLQTTAWDYSGKWTDTHAWLTCATWA